MKTTFQILFSIEVVHNFFSTGCWNDVDFVPTPETEKLLREYGFTTRHVGNELLVISKTGGDGSVYHDIALYTRFSFMLVPRSAGYLNFTNIAFSTAQPPVYNFNNLSGNNVGSKHFISRKIRSYKSGTAYLPGNFVKGADGKIYECIAKNNGSVAPANSAASKKIWVLYGDMQFVSDADANISYAGKVYKLEVSDGIYNFKTSVKSKDHAVNVYAFANGSLPPDGEMLAANASADDVFDLVQVDMRRLPSGKYRVTANNDTRFIYLINNIRYNPQAFFVDIFNLPAGDPQAFLDGAKKPKRTKYTIAFAARRVLWNYNTRTNTIDKIEDTAGDIIFKPDGLRKFVSEKPVPFSDTPRKTLVAKSGALVITPNLPNPQADRLLDKQNEIYTSVTFINY